MVVVRLGARAPLRSLACTSTPPLALRKFDFGNANARKNIFGVSKNDGEKNLKLAASILQSSVASFVKKWNFNPITEKPLSTGRYSWVPIQPQHPQEPDNKELPEMNLAFKSSTLSTTPEKIDPKPSSVDEINVFPSEETENDEEKSILLPSCTNSLSPLINSMNLTSVHLPSLCGDPKSVDPRVINSSIQQADSDDKFSMQSSYKAQKEKKFRQTKITEYGRIMKRKSRLTKY